MTTATPERELPDQIVEFELDGQRYCIGIEPVEEIVRAETLSSLPNAPAEVAGMMNLRGQTTTILDLSRIFEISAVESAEQVIIFGGEDRIGWLVNRVNQVTNLREMSVEPGPDTPFVSGLVSDSDELVIWVEPEIVNESVSYTTTSH